MAGIDLNTYYPDVVRMVHKRFRTYGIPPEDLIQEVCVALLKKNKGSNSFDTARGMKPSSYIYMVARSTALNLNRHNRRYSKEVLCNTSERKMDVWHEEMMKGFENREVVHQIDAFLAPTFLFRFLFRLRWCEQKSDTEISRQLAWSLPRTRNAIADMETTIWQNIFIEA